MIAYSPLTRPMSNLVYLRYRIRIKSNKQCGKKPQISPRRGMLGTITQEIPDISIYRKIRH